MSLSSPLGGLEWTQKKSNTQGVGGPVYWATGGTRGMGDQGFGTLMGDQFPFWEFPFLENDGLCKGVIWAVKNRNKNFEKIDTKTQKNGINNVQKGNKKTPKRG